MDTPQDLKEDREFFLGYRQKFGEVFLESLKASGTKVLSRENLKPLVDKLYTMLFSFTRDPVEELRKLSYELARLGLNLNTALSKALLQMLKDYIDYVIEKGFPHSRVKSLVMLIDTYVSAVEGAYARYIAELRREVREEKEVFVKHVNLPRPVAVVMREINSIEETMDLEVIGFRDLPQERRRYLRVIPEAPVSVTLKKGDWEAVGSMADISVGGVGVYLRDTDGLKVGDVVRVSFSLPKGEIRTDALIRHITPQGDVFRVGMSCELDLRQEEIVSDYVMERQFEILKELKGS